MANVLLCLQQRDQHFAKHRNFQGKKVKQHFYPSWRVNSRKAFVVPLLVKVAELYVVRVPAPLQLLCRFCRCFSSNKPCGQEAAGRQHLTSLPAKKLQKVPLLTGFFCQPQPPPSHQHSNSVIFSSSQVTAVLEKEKNKIRFK